MDTKGRVMLFASHIAVTVLAVQTGNLPKKGMLAQLCFIRFVADMGHRPGRYCDGSCLPAHGLLAAVASLYCSCFGVIFRVLVV
jgi:hypothetical protein